MNLNPISSAKQWYLICYDIVEDRRRIRVMKLLKGYGFAVQKSVFECLLSASALDKLSAKLAQQINPQTDSIRIYGLCEGCRRGVRIIGCGEVPEIPTVKVI